MAVSCCVLGTFVYAFFKVVSFRRMTDCRCIQFRQVCQKMQNVLRNQSIRRFRFAVNNKRKHTLTIKAMDEGIVLDQVVVTPVT